MWKAYTRETPARRGWAIGANIIGFVAVLGMAKLTIDYRQSHGIDQEEATSHSPLRISLPDSYEWSVRSFPQLSENELGQRTIIYHGSSQEYGECDLTIMWIPAERDLSLDDLAERLTDIDPVNAEEIQFGSARGLMQVTAPGKRKTEISGIGQLRDGLVVLVDYVGTGKTDHEETFRNICRGINRRRLTETVGQSVTGFSAQGK